MSAEVSAKDQVFVLKARRTAEYALFFLLHVGNVRQEVDDVPAGHPKRSGALDVACTYVNFALEQVASLIYSVHVSRDYLPSSVEAARDTEGRTLPRAPGPIAYWRDEIWERTNRMRPQRDVLWRAGGDTREEPLGQVLARAAELTEKLHDFLRETRPTAFEPRLLSYLADARRAVGRRFTFCLGVVISLGLLLGVEAVRSLILNQGVHALWPLGLGTVPLLLFLPGPARRLKIDWGRRAFVSDHTAEPDPTIVRWPAGNLFTYRMPLETIRSLALLVGSFLILGLGLWLACAHDRKSTSFLTVFISLALVMLFLRLCLFLDRWDFLDERPIRLRALSVGAVGVVLILGEWFWPLGLFVLVVGAGITWRMFKRNAPKLLIRGAAFLTVLASFSALHAAFTSDSWHNEKDLSRHVMVGKWPMGTDQGPVVVLAASGGGSRAAIYTAKTLMRMSTELPDIADHLQAISSVSGGSLTAAAYIARKHDGRDVKDLEEAVSNDFLLPTLMGAFTPWSSRGRAIEESWRKPGTGTPAMGDLTMSDLALAWNEAVERKQALPPFPMPLFNTCALDGHDVVVTPLDRHLYTNASNERWHLLRNNYGLKRSDMPTWVVDRDAIYGLEDLLPTANVLLASAVRASASFPFGFPLVEVETCSESLFLNPTHDISTPEAARRTARNGGTPVNDCQGPTTVHLTDGGVLSNSGMWSLFQLMNNPDTEAALSTRGVLLVLVEASKMPEFTEDRRSLLTLYGILGDRKPVAQSLHRRMFELLHDRYGKRLAIEQLDLIPEAAPKSFNVYTTWALDPLSNKTLDRSFEVVWKTARNRIRTRFDQLANKQDPGLDELLRPPLD